MVSLNLSGWAEPSRWPRETRDTLFLIAVTAWTVAPHLSHLPAWSTAGVIALLGWRALLALRGSALPGRWTIVSLLALAALMTWWKEGTLLGKEAGVTLLVMLMALKTLELRARRDAMVIFFLGFFIVLTHFLYSQSLLTAAAMGLSVWGLLTALVLAHMPVGRPSLSRAGGVAARAALLGAPIMVALFVLFPRVGPLWGLPGDAAGRTGLSGTLRLGEMAEIAADDTIALRVRFDGAAPAPQALYFRGPVLSYFDGREWVDEATAASSRSRSDAAIGRWSPAARWPMDLTVGGEAWRYEMMLEPHRLPMLPLLEGTAGTVQVRPAGALPGLRQRPDLQWRTPSPVTDRLTMQAQAWPQFSHGLQAPDIGLRDMVDLPPGRNPRTLAWAAELRRQPAYAEADARTLTRAVLSHIRRENFRYTIAPGLYSDDAVDEFWLDRREGFCEHFAAAFVVVMRALDVPARIVTGYQGADPQPVDGWWIVRRSHAHAWAEVWQSGEGWLRVDPTAAVAPERIVRSLALRPAPGLIGQALAAVHPELLLQIRRAWERIDQRWNQWVLGYTKTQQSGLMNQLGIDTPDVATLSRLLLGGLGALAALGALWLAWDRQRQDPWQRLQRHIAKRLARVGVTVAPHEGPRARACRVRDTLGLAAEPLADVLVALDRARYAASPGEGHRETDTAPVWKRRFDRAWRDYRPPVNARSPGAADMRPLAGALIALSLAWGADSGAQANAATRTESASSPPARARAQDKAQKPRVLKRKTASSAPASAQRASAARPARPPARATGAEDVPLAYGRRADILQFAAEVAQRRGMDASALEKHLAQAQRLPTVQRLIMPPPAGTAKDWAAYRARFVEPRRIEAGLRFWRQHENWLELAEARWGVPASLIVGIIGVETLYGRHTGNFRVIDALATLTFDFPPGRRDRSAFFRDELEELFAWAQRQGVDPSAIKGSYAGAVGLPQFMPGSINRWAVDFDEDGRIDLQGSAADAIGSVAHYLAGFGWQRDMPTHFSVAAPVEVADRVTLLGPDILPTFTAAEFAARGAMLPPEAQAHDGPLALVELQNGEAAPSYVAGTRNFYAVTRYNWSSYYAMAVIELGQAVRSAVRRQEGTTPPSAPGSRD